MPINRGPSFTAGALRRAALVAASIALPGAVLFAGFSSPPSAAAKPALDAVSPAFAQVPRFTTGRAAPRTLGIAPANSGACNPGPVTTKAGTHDVVLDLPLRRVPAQINNPTEQKIDQLELRTYSGCLTSPLIEARPGDT
ncbi:MAG TPA: hypothetical protein VFF00_04755, partial [Candidatus Elarobacter sp.]|nr:hypothetical protein [Candidatus Elarobacter sp.]